MGLLGFGRPGPRGLSRGLAQVARAPGKPLIPGPVLPNRGRRVGLAPLDPPGAAAVGRGGPRKTRPTLRNRTPSPGPDLSALVPWYGGKIHRADMTLLKIAGGTV